MSQRTPATAESWENVYSGLDLKHRNTTTGWVMQEAEKVLPRPEISSTCKRKGHEWSRPFWPLFGEAAVRGCKRCARRGLIVIQTTQESR